MKRSVQDYLYVGLQLILFGLFGYSELVHSRWIPLDLPKVPPALSIGLIVLGHLIIGIALLQLGKRLSPFPSPKDNARLLTGGVFRWMRHPIYTGILSAFLGWSLLVTSWDLVALTAALALLFSVKASYEEKRLSQVFPEYEHYRKKTGKFLPWSK